MRRNVVSPLFEALLDHIKSSRMADSSCRIDPRPRSPTLINPSSRSVAGQVIETRPSSKARTIRQRLANCRSRPPAEIVPQDLARRGSGWPGGIIFVDLPWRYCTTLRPCMRRVNRAPLHLQRCVHSIVETTDAMGIGLLPPALVLIALRNPEMKRRPGICPGPPIFPRLGRPSVRRSSKDRTRSDAAPSRRRRFPPCAVRYRRRSRRRS